jgi:hypothetical protein
MTKSSRRKKTTLRYHFPFEKGLSLARGSPPQPLQGADFTSKARKTRKLKKRGNPLYNPRQGVCQRSELKKLAESYKI